MTLGETSISTYLSQATRDRYNRDTQKHYGDLNDSKIRVYKERFQSMFISFDFYHVLLSRCKYSELWGLQVNQKLETSSQ